MAEYIEREKAYEMLRTVLDEEENHIRSSYEGNAGYEMALVMTQKKLEGIPSADVRPERHGYWIRPNAAQTRSYKWKCSECGEISCCVYNGGKYNKNCVCKFLYCPNCGAKMDGKDDDL